MTKCNKTTDYSSHKYLVNISEVSSKKYFFLFSTFKIISNSELFQRLPRPNQLQERATKTTRKSNKTTDYCSHKYLVNISEVYHRKNIFFIFNFQNHFEFRIIPKPSKTQPPTRKNNKPTDDCSQKYLVNISEISSAIINSHNHPISINTYHQLPAEAPNLSTLLCSYSKRISIFLKKPCQASLRPQGRQKIFKEGKRYSKKAKDSNIQTPNEE